MDKYLPTIMCVYDFVILKEIINSFIYGYVSNQENRSLLRSF